VVVDLAQGGRHRIVLLIWQVVVTLAVAEYVLPGPAVVLNKLPADITGRSCHWPSPSPAPRLLGFALALVLGTLLGLAIVRSKTLRTPSRR
jgi:ABC-type nitrate/sulfonate/bicarbonate transport system permease component